jgi:hypothetical protein
MKMRTVLYPAIKKIDCAARGRYLFWFGLTTNLFSGLFGHDNDDKVLWVCIERIAVEILWLIHPKWERIGFQIKRCRLLSSGTFESTAGDATEAYSE